MKHCPHLIVWAALITVGAATGVPAVARAQSANRGQLVQAVAKLNQAQLALVKRLADDAAFAQQFESATASGNYDAAANLVSAASGLGKASIHISASAGGMGDAEAARTTGRQPAGFSLASVTAAKRSTITSAVVCFNLGIVSGCFKW